MTCARLDELLSPGPSAAALAHAKGCAECGPARAAWDAMSGSAETSALVTRLRDAARAELEAHPKARRWWVDALGLLALNAAVAGGALSMMTVREVGPGGWAIVALLGVLMGAGSWAAVRPGAGLLRLAMIAIALAAAVWAAVDGSGVGGPFASGVGCAVTEAALSLVPMAAALFAMSRFAFDGTRALVGGLSVGATGVLVLHLHCVDGTAEHLLAFHAVPWALVAVAALMIRRKLPSRSFAS